MANFSDKLVRFIAAYETLHDGDLTELGLQPKLDAVDNWTIGYGHLVVINHEIATIDEYPTLDHILKVSPTISKADAYDLLIEDLDKVTSMVHQHLNIQLPQHKIDALISHYYNCGYSSTMYKLVNTNVSEAKIKEWFTQHYITANGVPLKGLRLRRFDEYQMWSKGDYKRDYEGF